MAKFFGLGKGIDALLPMDDEAKEEKKETGGEVILPLEAIRANPGQPRTTFDEEALGELAASIREHGVIQPILVEKTEEGRYTIVAGERRFRAAGLAGLSEIPALVRDYSDQERLEVALIENIQRADLNPIEEAAAYKHLMEAGGLSQDEAAARVGKNRSTLANALRLLKLPPRVKGALASGAISAGHARAILAVDDAAGQERLFDEIVSGGLSVREAERLASEAASRPQAAGGEERAEEKPPPGGASRKDPELTAMERKFIEALGTKVVVEGNFCRGTVKIEYFSMDDLDRIYRLINHTEAKDAVS